MKAGRIHVGTSGWHYRHWKGPFYPEDLPQQEMLAFYARHFESAEVNNSFYRLPEERTLRRWCRQVPEGFVFAAKASRYLTHMKKLKDPEGALEKLFGRLSLLKEKLGPVLFQLPPRWGMDAGRLRDFLAALPAQGRFAFEFRDPNWFHPEIYEALAGRGAAFCIFELAGELSPREVTSDFVYLRLHGPAGAYEGRYGRQGLSGWAGALSSWSRAGKDVYCYFDNDEKGYAPQDALLLREMLE